MSLSELLLLCRILFSLRFFFGFLIGSEIFLMVRVSIFFLMLLISVFVRILRGWRRLGFIEVFDIIGVLRLGVSILRLCMFFFRFGIIVEGYVDVIYSGCCVGRVVVGKKK